MQTSILFVENNDNNYIFQKLTLQIINSDMPIDN